MKYKCTISFEVDTTDYTDVKTQADVKDLVGAMTEHLADIPDEYKIDVKPS